MDERDYLCREKDVEKIFNLAVKISENNGSISFAIDGDWGCGKSFLLKMIEDKLKLCQSEKTNDDRFAVFHYNCWQYDYYDEPLVAIVSMMINQIEKSEKLVPEDKKKKALAVLKGVGAVVLAGFDSKIEDKTGINVRNILEEIKEIEDGTAQTLKNLSEYDPFWSFNQALDSMRKTLIEIAETKTIVFVVDELDRCLPEYAIKILERLHHITDEIENIITIIAIDKKRLLKSVANAFGYGNNAKDSEKYLEKFVKFSIPLGNGVLDDDISQKYDSFLKMFNREDFCCQIDSKEYCFNDYLSDLFDGINMREQEYLMQKAETVHLMVSDYDKKYDYTVMYMELLLTVFCSYYGGKVDTRLDLIKHLSKLFKEKTWNYKYFTVCAGERKNVISDDILQIMDWYYDFLQKCNVNGRLPGALLYSENLSRDTSKVIGINLENNLEFLYHFYQKLIKL